MDLLIVEDIPALARTYYKSLDGDKLKQVVEISNYRDEAIDIIKGKQPPSKFILDMRLGDDNEGGEKIVEAIKSTIKSPFIIVYSGFDYEHNHSDLSDIYYFRKRGSQLRQDFAKFQNLIYDFNIKKNIKMADNLLSCYAQIAHIDQDYNNGIVKLICHIDDKQLERTVPMAPVVAALDIDFGINKWVKVTISYNGPQVRTTYRKVYSLPFEVESFENDDIISKQEYRSSNLWRK